MLVYPGLGQVLADSAFDPMVGILDAMGNNPDAAMHFLAPSAKGSNSDADTTRMKRLAQRNWEIAGYSGFTAALAAVSTKRASSSPDEAARASDATGTAIHNLAYYGNQRLYNDDAKARVGMILANCAPEVTATWAGGDPTDPRIKNSNATLPGATYNDITALGYRIADNADATATVGAAIGNYTHERTQDLIAQHPNDKDENLKAINNSYKEGVKATGVLAGLADQKAKALTAEDQDKAAANSASSRAAINVFTDTALAGLGAIGGGPAGVVVNSAAARMAKPALTTMLTPVIADATNEADPQPRTSAMHASPNEAVYAAAVQDDVNAGAVNPDDLKGYDYSWLSVDGNGKYHMDATSADVNQVHSWSQKVKETHSSPELSAIEDDFDGSYSTGRNKGSEAGELLAQGNAPR